MNLARTCALLLALGLPLLLGAQENLAKATACYEEAEVLDAQNENLLALPLAQQALALREAAPGPHRSEVAWSLVQVGNLLNNIGRLEEAKPLLVRAGEYFAALKEPGGEGAAAIALAQGLGQTDPKAARMWLAKGLERVRVAGDRQREAQALTISADFDYWAKRRVEAQASLRQALALYQDLKRARGGTLPPSALEGQGETLIWLGIVVRERGELAQAKGFFEASLPLFRQAGNKLWEGVALTNLAKVLGASGNWPAGITLLEQALALVHGKGDEFTEAATHRHLGLGYLALGQPDRARLEMEQARDQCLAIGNVREAGYAWIDLGLCNERLGLADQGIEAVKQGLALLRKTGNPEMAFSGINRLAILHRQAGHLELARSYAEQALAQTRTYPDPRDQALGERELGELLLREDRPQESIPHLERALAFFPPRTNPLDGGRVLAPLAGALDAAGRAGESTARFQELVDCQEGLLDVAFPTLTEAQKLAYAREFELSHYRFIGHTVASASTDPQALRLCFNAWLAFKGVVLDSQERVQAAIREAKDPEVRALAQALSETRLAYASLAQGAPSGLSAAEYAAKVRSLKDQREAQEVALARHSGLFAASLASRRLDSARLAHLLPAGLVYVDYALSYPSNTRTGVPVAPRYAAFILRSGQTEPQLFDLGPSEPLDAEIRSLHEDLQAGRPVQEALEALHRKLLLPLEPSLAGATAFTISPFGALNLVPFELLQPAGGMALMDRGPVNYVTAGRDFARFQDLGRPKGNLAILADPDFDQGLPPLARKAAKATLPRRPGTRPPDPKDVRGLELADGKAGYPTFPRLPGTRLEAKAILRALPRLRCVPLLGAEATEKALLAVSAPWALHLATHGYFLPTPAGAAPQSPMLRSGLALAGANAAFAGQGDDGLFCADKVLGLDLQGTSLVVLSACNTGLGSMKDAEGVFGLRRAFVLAGAQTLLVSLWPVPDAATQELMGHFYRHLAKGLNKAEALRQAKQAMRALEPHPRNWAGFVLVGNPS